MSNNVRTRLELSENGRVTPRKQSRKRKPSKKKERVQEPKIQEVSDVETVPIEEQNVIFRPNKGPQTEFLAARGKRSIIWWFSRWW